ncbi:MAG: hypothetical protein WD942_06140 [Dehalococcoidia bacterium]
MPSEPDPLDQILSAQQQQLQAAREQAARLRNTLKGRSDAVTSELLEVPSVSDYDALTSASRDYLQTEGRIDLDLADLLEPQDLDLLLLESQRLGWTTSDLAAVGVCGLVGSVTALLADAIDHAIVQQLGLLEQTELISRWKRETKNLPIDYSGTYVGGPAHRVTSAGHDIGRPVEAIRQIVEGTYEGTGWSVFGKVTRTAEGTPFGTPYDAVPDVRVALALWVKHLITDVITPTSLPLPGWTALYEQASTEQLADFFKDMYWPGGGNAGWNLRTMAITKSIPLVTVEVGIRGKLGWDAWTERGSLQATDREREKRDEMLLAAHGAVTAVTSGQAVIECLTTSSPLGLRSINPQSILRTAQLGIKVVAARRSAPEKSPPSWEELAIRSLADDADNRLGAYTI